LLNKNIPYTNFTKKVEGKTKYCMTAIKTGRTYCYNSAEARKRGARMHEIYAHKK